MILQFIGTTGKGSEGGVHVSTGETGDKRDIISQPLSHQQFEYHSNKPGQGGFV